MFVIYKRKVKNISINERCFTKSNLNAFAISIDLYHPVYLRRLICLQTVRLTDGEGFVNLRTCMDVHALSSFLPPRWCSGRASALGAGDSIPGRVIPKGCGMIITTDQLVSG